MEDDTTVVCLGASAGGFAAYCEILSLLPCATGFSFIIVHHQAADARSLLVEILPRFTPMPVTLAIEGEVMKANHVYVVPAGSDVAMSGDRLKLSPCAPRYGWPKNITRFLLSLATSHQHRAIAVILSGFDSDGAAALKEIKEAGGLVIAQQPDTAKQPSMPESAVETGHVDLILSPGAIAAHLCDIAGERQSVMQ